MPRPQRLGSPPTQASHLANRWLSTESLIHPTGYGASFALWAVDGEPTVVQTTTESSCMWSYAKASTKMFM